MRIKWRLAIASILFCVLPMQGQKQGSHIDAGDKIAVDSNWSDLKSSMEKMHEAMASVASSGNADLDFVRLMVPHHQAAIDMARAQLLSGKDPEIRRLAQEIITEQQSEIELMQLWLKRHGHGSK